MWIPAGSGLYRVAAAENSWCQRLAAACFDESAWASHRTAANLWRLPGFGRHLVEVVSPRGAGRSMPNVLWHETRLTADEDFTVVDGFPSTNIGRTLVDLAAVTAMPRIEEAMDDAFRRRLIAPAEFWDVIDRVARPNRRGSRRIRRIAAVRSGQQTVDSPLEDRFLRLLTRHGLPRPTAQYEIFENGMCVARLDFAYTDSMLAIEVDGFRWHSSRIALQRDAARQRVLAARGWRVMHVTDLDLADFGSLAAEIRRAVALPAAHSA
jgi:hypothetical protein